MPCLAIAAVLQMIVPKRRSAQLVLPDFDSLPFPLLLPLCVESVCCLEL